MRGCMRRSEIVPKGAIGVNDPEKGTPITEDMVFDPASVTKQFRIRKRQLKLRRIYLQKSGRAFGRMNENTRRITHSGKVKSRPEKGSAL